MLIGYARTSTADQTAGLHAQHRDLEAAGVLKKSIPPVCEVGAIFL